MDKKEYHKKIYDIKTWQNIHVKQLSYTRNLILILATASLAFTINKYNSDNHGISCMIYFGLQATGVLFLISIACGLLIAILESENYRLKYRIARNVERDIDFKNEQNKCSLIEKVNKYTLYIQIGLFLIGIITLCLTLL